MISKRITAVLAGATSLSLLLAACGGNGDDSSSTSSGDTVKSLTILDYYNNDPDKSLVQKGLDSCASQLGITIQRETVPGDTLIQKVLQQASSKTLPDVLMLDNPDIQQIAATGALAPLERLRDQRPTASCQGMVDAATYDGKLYGLQPVTNTIAIFYNKDMLAEGRRQAAEDLGRAEGRGQEADQARQQYGFAFNATADYEGAWQFLPPMWTNGGDETDLTSPQVAEALQLWKDLVDRRARRPRAWSTGRQADVERPVHRRQGRDDAERPVADPGAGRRPRTSTAAWSRSRSTSRTRRSVAPLGGEAWTVPLTGTRPSMRRPPSFVKCMNSDENQLAAGQGAVRPVPTKLALADQYKKEVPAMAGFAERSRRPAPAPASSATSGPTPPR